MRVWFRQRSGASRCAHTQLLSSFTSVASLVKYFTHSPVCRAGPLASLASAQLTGARCGVYLHQDGQVVVTKLAARVVACG
jgi:hypothetical protein